MLWDFGDGTTLSGTNTMPTHTYTASGTYTVILSMYNSNGTVCSSTTLSLVVNCLGGSSNNVGGTISKSAPGTFLPANAVVYLID